MARGGWSIPMGARSTRWQPTHLPPRSDDDLIANCSRYVDQLRGWGFTGIAGWASATTYAKHNDVMLEQGKPTFALFKVINFHDAGKYGEFDMLTDRDGNQKSGEHGFPDPFDPRFEVTAYKKAAATVESLADRRDVIAWFVDNEMSFSELYRYVWSEHCGEALLKHLRGKYETIGALNERWGAGFADWDALRAQRPAPLMPKGPMYDDLVAFERVLVKRYVDISIAAIRAVDANHLIASNRFNMGGHEAWMRTIDLASAYDIVACNLYPSNQEPGVGRAGLQVLREVARRTGRPMIMGEWSVPAMDSGLYEMRKAKLDWSFPQTVPTQEIRAAQAARIAADYFNEPYMVGAHWFIYRDFDSE
ncbi:MAG TPA: beta-galactosidase, partial [Armatimonadota bacterium]|nr:beta-galactosidase [Armatimonadota bacterium]